MYFKFIVRGIGGDAGRGGGGVGRLPNLRGRVFSCHGYLLLLFGCVKNLMHLDALTFQFYFQCRCIGPYIYVVVKIYFWF